MKEKYVVYSLSLHMVETSCPRSVRTAYTDNCKVTPRAPSNYCEV